MNTTPPDSRILGDPWDNPGDILSHNDYLTALFVLNSVVKPVIVLVGVPANVLNCLVFWRQGLRDHMNICLLSLTLAELGLLLTTAINCLGFYLAQVNPIRWGELYLMLQVYCMSVNQGFRTASGYITMIIAIERCVCVMFPLRAASFISSRSLIGLLAVVVALPQACFFTVPARYVVVRVNNNTIGFIYSKMYISNRDFFDLFENVLMMTVIPSLCLAVTSLATGVTVVRLRAAMKWRSTTSSIASGAQTSHVVLTRMLVVLSCVYIAITVPWVLFYLANLTVKGFNIQGRYYNFFMTSLATIFCFPYLNSAVSFFIYFIMSSRFRRDVAALFHCEIFLCAMMYKENP